MILEQEKLNFYSYIVLEFDYGCCSVHNFSILPISSNLCAYPAGNSLHNFLYATVGCNSLQWFDILSSYTHAKQCNSCMYLYYSINFLDKQFPIKYVYILMHTCALEFSDGCKHVRPSISIRCENRYEGMLHNT